MTKMRVLFIDDDTSLQTLATALMSGGTFEVIAATRTAQAEKVLASRMVDVIVCDVMMPDEDGLEFCRRLRGRGNKTPLLFLSAVGDPTTIQHGLAAGADDYLVKPFDIRELQKKLVAMVGKPHSAKPASQPKTPKSTGLKGWLRF